MQLVMREDVVSELASAYFEAYYAAKHASTAISKAHILRPTVQAGQ
jgi:hypothetical protein